MTTETVDELLEEKRKFEGRKLGLLRYQMELRKIAGNISEITYRTWENREQEKKSLQAQRKTIAEELKAEYNVTPALIPYQLTQYNHALSEINRKLHSVESQGIDNMERQPKDNYHHER